MKKVVVVGYGSIGQRHTKNFRALGCEVAIVSRREIAGEKRFLKVETALASFRPDVVIVSNKTAEHAASIRELEQLGFNGLIIVEKPVFAEVAPLSFRSAKDIRVAYNLRFHQILRKLHGLLATSQIVSAHAYVGQHLSTWRPQNDYRQSYSARRSEGGGVLLDLSHEFDFLQWLLGPFKKVVAQVGHFSELEIDTEDTASVLATCERAPHVSITLNYTDRCKRRTLTIITTEHTYEVDLVGAALRIDGEKETYTLDANHSYEAMARDVLQNNGLGLTSLKDAIETVRVVEAVRQSSAGEKWISL